MQEHSRARDSLHIAAGFNRPTDEGLSLYGHVLLELFDENGNLKDSVETGNLITQVGDQYWGERAAGIATPPAQVTGMQLGTGTTAPAKTGVGAAVVTYVAGSAVAIDGGFPTSALSGSSRRIQWKTTWAAGVATANSISEVVLINQAIATNAAAPEANTIARALLSPVVNKASGDSLACTWSMDLLGA